MNEPIIDPWFFYWISLLEPLQIILGVATMLSGVVLVLSFFHDVVEYGKKELAGECDIKKRFGGPTKIAFISLLVFLPLALLTPSKQTMIEMKVAEQATPENIEAVLETVDKYIDLDKKRR